MQILEKINKFGIVYVIDFCYKAAMSDSSPSKAPRVGAVLSVGRSAGARRGRVGFSLIEVAISLGVVSFAFVSILSLVPLGMTTFHSAMDISVGTQISQRVVNDLQQTDFGTLINSTQPVRYFDEQGQEVPSATGAVYQVNTPSGGFAGIAGRGHGKQQHRECYHPDCPKFRRDHSGKGCVEPLDFDGGGSAHHLFDSHLRLQLICAMSDVELSCRPIRLGGTGRDFRRKGFALLVTLTALVIITVLILAFFLGVTNEYVTAKSYSDGVNTKFMTDTAVNIVMGQIDAATQGQQADDTKHRYTWASQPGMIRTYSDGDLDTQVAANCFKLYSSSTMVFAGTSGANILSQAAADVPSGWNGQPSRYTDLNAPVVDITGTLNFPIIDGNGLMPLTVNGQQVLTYDTNGDGIPDVEGFSVPATSATYDSTQPISASNNPVSMPVQWLYVLKDGTITSPDPATSSTASQTVQWTPTRTDAPTPSNPIVGRIAFWTDDDTSKLNVNTASEGTYYGAPTALNYMDNASNVTGKTFGFASSPPATGEYSRYPGHPAQTCLSVVLGSWVGSKLSPPLNLNVLNAPTAYSAATDDSNYLSGLQQYLQGATGTALLPRYGFGGSEAGTVASANTPTGTPYAAVTSATNRLFVSPDELIFDPTRANFPGLDKTVVKKLGFFLTANSRAPELTPFNTPKVSIWPQWMKLADRNSASGSVLGTSAGHTGGNTDLNNNFKNYFKSDKFYSSVLAFCSEFGTNASSPSGKNEYFFQRFKAGTTSSFGSWFDTYDDWDNVPRNQQLANYLCNMGTLSIPGYGKPFVGDKYTARNFSQIVLETFDYIAVTSIALVISRLTIRRTTSAVVMRLGSGSFRPWLSRAICPA